MSVIVCTTLLELHGRLDCRPENSGTVSNGNSDFTCEDLREWGYHTSTSRGALKTPLEERPEKS